jgi:hypothetical protein
MKALFLIFFLAFSVSLKGQDEKTVTLVVSGQGKTQEEARQVALRSAIEQVFGAFISSKSEVLNDSLVKDEIVSITNGNIQKFEPISEVQLPYNSFASTLKATVSTVKLTSFCESKGIEVDFKGGLFAANIKMQQLNEESEEVVLTNLVNMLDFYNKKCISYSLEVDDPKLNNDGKYNLKFKVTGYLNNNYILMRDYFIKVMASIAMSQESIDDYYKTLKKPTRIDISTPELDSNLILHFRNASSVSLLDIWLMNLNRCVDSFDIKTNQNKLNLENSDFDSNVKNKNSIVESNFFFASNVSNDYLIKNNYCPKDGLFMNIRFFNLCHKLYFEYNCALDLSELEQIDRFSIEPNSNIICKSEIDNRVYVDLWKENAKEPTFYYQNSDGISAIMRFFQTNLPKLDYANLGLDSQRIGFKIIIEQDGSVKTILISNDISIVKLNNINSTCLKMIWQPAYYNNNPVRSSYKVVLNY